MGFQNERNVPLWVWGVLLALVLIAVSTGGSISVGNPALSLYFSAQPTPADADPKLTLPQLNLSQLPQPLQQPARDLWRSLGRGGSGTPLEPQAQSLRLRVVVRELKKVDDGLQILGQVTNISADRLQLPISAFELRDSSGASYIAGGGASANLAAGESTDLELTVPLPAGRGLLLVTRFPPDPPLEQRLIVAEDQGA